MSQRLRHFFSDHIRSYNKTFANSRDRPGHAVVMAYMIVFLLGGSALQYVLLRAENAKRLAGKRHVWVAGKGQKEIDALGDKQYVQPFLTDSECLLKISCRPGFLYTL